MIIEMEVRKPVSLYGTEEEAEYFINNALETINYILATEGEISLLKIFQLLNIRSGVKKSSQYIGQHYEDGCLTKPPVAIRKEGYEYVFEFNMTDLVYPYESASDPHHA